MEFQLSFFEEVMLLRRDVSLLIFRAPAAKAANTVIKAVLKGVSEANPIQEPVEYRVYVLSEKDILAPQIKVDSLQSSLEVFFHIIACGSRAVIRGSQVHPRVPKGILDISPNLDLVVISFVNLRPPWRLHVWDLFLFVF